MYETNGSIACFTGHRDIPPEHMEPLEQVLENTIRRLATQGIKEFRNGGALGFDLLAAQKVLALREELGLKLILYIPCPSQSQSWAESDRKIYDTVVNSADRVLVVSPHYYSSCMLTRDRTMVTGSDVCIAYYRGTPGGTRYTVCYALKSSVEIINLYDSLA